VFVQITGSGEAGSDGQFSKQEFTVSLYCAVENTTDNLSLGLKK